jgi:hypothetical protein
MGDKIQDIPSIDFLLLYFTDETAAEAGDIIKKYKNGLKLTGEYTRNLYYRDLI